MTPTLGSAGASSTGGVTFFISLIFQMQLKVVKNTKINIVKDC